jgi:exodeoxyribonuclease-5
MNATTPALSDDQAKAREAIHAAFRAGERVAVLTGPAGSGKTTLIRTLIGDFMADGVGVSGAAPTGKAASRLREVTGLDATTVHKLLYRRVWEDRKGRPHFEEADEPCRHGEVLVVDEASMVDTRLHGDLVAHLPKDARLLYVGDREQLPPVAGTFGPDFDHPTALLTEVHRQALDNPILAVATSVREGGRMPHGAIGEAWLRRKGGLLEVADAVVRLRREGADIAVLTWRNAVRRAVNTLVRQSLGRVNPVEVGDRLLVLRNNRFTRRMNGETVTVAGLTPFPETVAGREVEGGWSTPAPMEREGLRVVLDQEDGDVGWVQPELLGAESKEFAAFAKRTPRAVPAAAWLHVDHGEALTVHRSQGSEFSTVFFVVDAWTRRQGMADPVMARRIAYTAITRAKQRVVVWDL